MSEKQHSSIHPAFRWAIILFLSAAFALMINVVGFFILLMFLQNGDDTLVKHYLIDTHDKFFAVTGGLMLVLIPFVKRIPFKVE